MNFIFANYVFLTRKGRERKRGERGEQKGRKNSKTAQFPFTTILTMMTFLNKVFQLAFKKAQNYEIIIKAE